MSHKMIEIGNYPKAATELDLYIHQLTDRENEERDKMTKKYTGVDEKESEAYEKGFADGYRAGSEDGFAKGFDEGLKEAAKEQKEKEEEEEV
jgi:flagellar biosynthesis/type III secretory pathway protein FliH